MVDQPQEEDSAMDNATESTEDFDRRIYAGLMSGQREAWNEFYDHYAGRLDSFFQNKNVYNKQDREDLLHETLRAIYKSLPRYDPEGAPFRNWVYGVARNIMLKHQKKYSERYAQEYTGEKPLELASFQAGNPFDPEPSSEADPRLPLLKQALAMLPEAKQQILRLRNSRTATWVELSEELGIGVSAAKMRYIRALKGLRELIDSLDTDKD